MSIEDRIDIKVDAFNGEEWKTVWLRRKKHIDINELTVELDNDDWQIIITPKKYYRVE